MSASVNPLSTPHSTSQTQADPDNRRWFALRVRTSREKLVSTAARHKGFDELLPVYRSRRQWSDRTKTMERPLFPGYLFCRLNPDDRLPLLSIPGVVNIVGIGRTPVPLDDAEIAAIRSTEQSGLQAEPCPFFTVGQRVRLEAGPLQGLEGLLVNCRNTRRFVVSVTLLMRSVAVEIESHWARPLTDDFA